MRVVHIISGLGVGGAEGMLARLVSELRGRVEAHVISIRGDGPVSRDLRQGGAVVHTIDMDWSLRSLVGFARLTGLLRDLAPDVVQTWMYHADLIGGVAARLAGIRAVAWNIRNGVLSPSEKVGTRAVVRLSALLSSIVPRRVVCCSQAARMLHERFGYSGSRLVVIPNGFDLQRFKPDASARVSVREELGLPAGTHLVGLIARFNPQKDHGLFFRAAAKLHAVAPSVHFVLAGTGVDEGNEELRAWAKQAGVAHVTSMLGERADVPRLTAALDVATCCSSWGESFPNTLGEASACGVPSVTTEVGGAAEVVGEDGWIVPCGDADALASAWKESLSLSSRDRERVAKRVRQRVEERFEIGVIARCYEQMYESFVQSDR